MEDLSKVTQLKSALSQGDIDEIITFHSKFIVSKTYKSLTEWFSPFSPNSTPPKQKI